MAEIGFTSGRVKERRRFGPTSRENGFRRTGHAAARRATRYAGPMSTAEPDPRLTAIARSCVALHVRMTARAVTRAYDEALRPCGLKCTQFVLLSALGSGAYRSVTELADRLALERTSLTRNLQLLAADGLIEPTLCKGRAQTYVVTQKGRAAVESAIPLWQEAQDRIERGLGAERWSAARDELRALRRVARGDAPVSGTR